MFSLPPSLSYWKKIKSLMSFVPFVGKFLMTHKAIGVHIGPVSGTEEKQNNHDNRHQHGERTAS